jgi:hypothetical protein
LGDDHTQTIEYPTFGCLIRLVAARVAVANAYDLAGAGYLERRLIIGGWDQSTTVVFDSNLDHRYIFSVSRYVIAVRPQDYSRRLSGRLASYDEYRPSTLVPSCF